MKKSIVLFKQTLKIQNTAKQKTYYYLLKAYSSVNHTGSPQGVSQVQISHVEYNTKHAHYIQK